MRALLAFAATFLVADAASAHEIARESRPFTATTHGRIIAWSSWDTASRAYRLKLWRDGNVSVPAIPTRGLPFDVDLGEDAAGRLTAVYSRCRDQGDPGSFGEFGEPQRPSRGESGCDLWALNVESGVEKRLAGLSNPRRDEREPSLHRGRIAFVRSHARPSSSLPRDIVYRGRLDGAASRRAPMPRPGRIARVPSLDLGARGLAYVYVDEGFGFSRHTLYRVRRGGLARLYSTSSGGANASAIVGPSLSGSQVYFAETNSGSGTGNRIYRMRVTGSGLMETRGSSMYQSLGYFGGGRVVVSTGRESCVGRLDDPASESRCRLQILGPFSWRRP